MVGLRHLATRSPRIATKSLEYISMKSFGCISLMSAPAAKAFSLPVKTMQPIPSSASRSSTALAISRNTPKDSALSIFGRLSVMTPTLPLASTMMCSNVLMIHPALYVASNVPADAVGYKWRGDHRIPDAVRRSPGDAEHCAVRCFAQSDPHIFHYSAMSPGSASHRLRATPRPRHETNQVMNIRAAEAMVSSAPNPM